jgi:hypothetical protein
VAPVNRNPEVDRWFDQAGHPLDATMRRARDIILGADGRVTESIKWKTPTFAYRGNIASFNPSKHLLSIMFHRGSEIPGEHPRLEGDGRLVRTMRFADLDQLEAGRADLEAVLRAWCDWRRAPPSRAEPGPRAAGRHPWSQPGPVSRDRARSRPSRIRSSPNRYSSP